MTISVDARTTLKIYDKDDVPALHTIIINERDRLRDWLSSVQNITTKNEVHQFIIHNRKAFDNAIKPDADGMMQGFQFGIFYDGKLTGQAGLQAINRKQDMAAIGYWISEDYEGLGLITKSCKAVIDYGFTNLNLNRIEIQSATDNPRSAAVPERLNFTREAILSQVEKRESGYFDHYLYRILREDWAK